MILRGSGGSHGCHIPKRIQRYILHSLLEIEAQILPFSCFVISLKFKALMSCFLGFPQRYIYSFWCTFLKVGYMLILWTYVCYILNIVYNKWSILTLNYLQSNMLTVNIHFGGTCVLDLIIMNKVQLSSLIMR